jgi:hypothetical protein
MDDVAELSDLAQRLDGLDSAGYFAEALVCFKAKAYRSCVIMVHSAVFTKLRKNISDLAELGLPGAEAALTDIVALERDKGNFESKIFAFLNKEILEEDQKKFLRILQVTRNDMAHASKREASEIEAKTILEDSIKYVLGPQKVRVGEFVPLLVRHLASRDFFPDRSIASVRLVVRTEVAELKGEEACARLVSQLAGAAELPGKGVKPELVGGEEAMITASSNAEDFLCGLVSEEVRPSSERDWEKTIRDIIFRNKMSRKLTVGGHGYLISLISVRPSLVQDLDAAFRMRIDQLFSSIFRAIPNLPEMDSSRHPGRLVEALLSLYSAAWVRNNFQMTLDTLIERFWSDEEVARAILNVGLGERLGGRMILHLRSCRETGEDEASKIVQTFDDELSSQMPASEATRLLEVLNRFKGSSLQKGNFFAIPSLRELARSYALEEMPGALEQLGLKREPISTSPLERARTRNPAAFKGDTAKPPLPDPAGCRDEDGDGRAPLRIPEPS